MRFILLAISCLFLCTSLKAQECNMRLGFSNSFVLRGIPVFGITFEKPVKNGLSIAGSFEFGRYAHSRKNILHVSLDSYEVNGIGILPEMRYYLNRKKRNDQLGPFILAYTRVRRFSESQWNGISVTEKGLTISNPNLVRRIGWNTQAGVAAGMHLGCTKLRLHAEIITGYGWGNTSWNQRAPEANPEITQKRRSLNGGSARMECSLIFCL